MRTLVPAVHRLSEIRLGELLVRRIHELELPLHCRRPRSLVLVRVLPARTLIKPVRLALAAVGSWRPDSPRQFLQPHVVRVVCGEVRTSDLVLRVRILRDEGNHLVDAILTDDRQLHLNADAREVDLVPLRCALQRRHRLTAVDNLEVTDFADPSSPCHQVSQGNLRCRRRHSVVVGEKVRRLVLQRVADAPVDVPTNLQERSDVALKQPRAELRVKRREELSRHDCEKHLVVRL